jgi:hypothetical protein
MDNVDIKTIRPLKGANLVKAHLLENFTEKNAVRTDEDVLHDLIQKNATAGARHGESVLLADMANYLDGQAGIKKGDVYGNERTRDLAIRNPQEGDELFGYDPNEFDYEVRTEAPFIGDEPEFTLGGKPIDFGRPDLPEEADLEQAYRQLGDLDDMRHEAGSFTEIKEKVQADLGRPRTRKVSRTSEIFAPVKEKARIAREKLNKLSETIKKQNKKALGGKPEVEMEDFGIRVEPISESTGLRVPSGISFTGFLNEFSPADVKNGGVRLSNKTRMAKAWEELGGEFTEEEKKMLDKNDVKDTDFHLTEDERAEIYDAAPPDRQGIADDYHQDVMDTMKATDEYTTIYNEEGTKGRTLRGNIVEGLNPISLSIGLVAGHSAEGLVNALDPNNRVPEEAKVIASGASGQVLGDIAIAQLAGETLGSAALGSSALAGGIGALTGYETYKGLKKAGASDFTATTTAGSAAGLTTALTSGLAAGALAGAPADVETLGLASAGGALLGGAIGGGSYLVEEGDKAIKDKMKKNGATDLEADLASKSAIGAGIGTMLLPGVGTVVGGLTGASISGISALAGYIKGKMF